MLPTLYAVTSVHSLDVRGFGSARLAGSNIGAVSFWAGPAAFVRVTWLVVSIFIVVAGAADANDASAFSLGADAVVAVFERACGSGVGRPERWSVGRLAMAWMGRALDGLGPEVDLR
ncbi:hypothetical protein ACA910_009730 [Epithemia clementina (nom. ined.)]